MNGFIISLPTSANALYVGRGKNIRRSSKYKGWLNSAGKEILQARSEKRFKNLAVGWYRTAMYWPAEDKADADNRIKAMHDLLRHMQCTPDDKWLWGSAQERSWEVQPGTCFVKFWNVGNEETQAPLDT